MSNVSHTLAKYSLLMVAVCYQNIRRTVHIWLVCKTFDNIYCSKLHDIPRIFSCIVLALHCYSQMWVCIRCRCVCVPDVYAYEHAHCLLVLSDCLRKHIGVCVCSYIFHELPSILLFFACFAFLSLWIPQCCILYSTTQLVPKDECSMYYCTYCICCTRRDQTTMLLWC